MDADLKTWISENVMLLDLEVEKKQVTSGHQKTHGAYNVHLVGIRSRVDVFAFSYGAHEFYIITVGSYESVCWKMIPFSYNILINIKSSLAFALLQTSNSVFARFSAST